MHKSALHLLIAWHRARTSVDTVMTTLRWRRNGHDSVSNHQPRDCFLNRLFRHRSKKTSKLCVTGLCVGNSPGTGEFPAQMASNAENVSIWWRHHELHGTYVYLNNTRMIHHQCVITHNSLIISIRWGSVKLQEIFTGPTYKLLLSFNHGHFRCLHILYSK